ncbi:MAG: hypothetical protein ABI863_21865 [Ginsengibacter sp.]
MEQYLIDTSVISDYFSASFFAAGTRFMDMVIGAIPNLSIITQIELHCWKTDNTNKKNVEDFISDSVILNITSEVINHCVTLRKTKE